MALIQIKRRLTGAVTAPPAAANAGELMFSVPGFTGGAANSLYIDTGTAVVPLVDNNRQVELTGDQILSSGVKTVMGTALVGFNAVTNVGFADGAAGQLLTKGAGLTVAWADAPSSAVSHDTSLTGDGVTIPLGVVQATQALLGGGMIATAALLTAGASDAALVSPAGLRSVTGDPATLVTTAKNALVPAINEIYNAIAALTGVVIYAGSYDATTSQGTFNGQGGIPAGTTALPAAAAGNQGAYVIVTVAGPGGVAPEPVGPIAVGDWIISDGTAWTRLAFNQPAMTAGNIAVSPAVAGASDVQAALVAIDAKASAPVLVTATTFSGDGVTTPLDLILADGGTF